jgi:hypothetical protein
MIADSSSNYLNNKLVGANGITTTVLDTSTGEELVVQPNTSYSVTIANNAFQLVGDQFALPLQVYSTDINGKRGWQQTGLVLTSSVDTVPGYLSQKISGASNGTGTILTNIIDNQLQISLGQNINAATLSGIVAYEFARINFANTFSQTNTFNGETDLLGPVFISNSSSTGTIVIQSKLQSGTTEVLLDNNTNAIILEALNSNFNILYNPSTNGFNSSLAQNIFQLTSTGNIIIPGTITLHPATNNNQAITLGQGNSLYGQLDQVNTWTQNNTFNANVNILGNLNVQGTMTTLNTANTTISDNIITLNSGDTGAGVSQGTAGVLIDRGTLPNVAVYWNETNKDWELTEDGTNFYHVLTTNDEPNINAGYLGGQPPSYYASVASLQNYENYVSNTYLPLAGGTITGNLTVDQTLNTSLLTVNLPTENSQNFALYRTNLPNGEAILNLQIGDTQDGLSYLSIGIVTTNWIDLFKFYNNGNLWVAGNISGSTINGSNLNISGTSSLNTVTANNITTTNLTATGNVVINGSINTTGTSPSSISVGNNVGTVNFVSNTDGTGGGYIEWYPTSGMPNQLNITGSSASPLSVFGVNASTTNISGNLNASNATFSGLTVNGNENVSGNISCNNLAVSNNLTSSNIYSKLLGRDANHTPNLVINSGPYYGLSNWTIDSGTWTTTQTNGNYNSCAFIATSAGQIHQNINMTGLESVALSLVVVNSSTANALAQINAYSSNGTLLSTVITITVPPGTNSYETATGSLPSGTSYVQIQLIANAANVQFSFIKVEDNIVATTYSVESDLAFLSSTISANSITSNQFIGALNVPDFQLLSFGYVSPSGSGASDNSDWIYFQRNNIATNVSMLQLVVGDNGSGTTISTPSGGANGVTDYFSIKAQDGIHHLWGTDGTYQAGGTITAPLFQGVSVQAEYADLAEKYTIDSDPIIGSVVLISDHDYSDCTISNEIGSHRVLGIISHNPAIKMNSSSVGEYIALKGRVACFVKGPVRKGDPLVSYLDGFAISVFHPDLKGKKFESYQIFAKALQSSDTDNLIEVVL